jgi:hypothetical protein
MQGEASRWQFFEIKMLILESESEETVESKYKKIFLNL